VRTHFFEGVYPSSPLQEDLVALSLDSRGSYVAQMVHRLGVSFDTVRFEAVWNVV
jgi:hypothetical protein